MLGSLKSTYRGVSSPSVVQQRGNRDFTRILTHQPGGVDSPCFLKILVIVSCTYCCNFALLKLKLPWRETKQTASVRDQETSIKH